MTISSCPIMLFAAGLGTRMGQLTKDRPKPLIEVAGKPLIDHALDIANAINPERIVANLHFKPEMLASHLQPKNVLLSYELPNVLETGGGLRNAMPILASDTVMTLNTDAIWAGPNPLKLLQQSWNPTVMDALLMCVPVERAIGHRGGGDFSPDGSGRARRGTELIYCGAQILKTQGLGDVDQAKFSLNVLWDRMLAEDRLYVAVYPSRWCDVGHPEGIKLAEDLLADV